MSEAPSWRLHEPTEAVNLIYFARYKLIYISQSVEYNCNQDVLKRGDTELQNISLSIL